MQFRPTLQSLPCPKLRPIFETQTYSSHPGQLYLSNSSLPFHSRLFQIWAFFQMQVCSSNPGLLLKFRPARQIWTYLSNPGLPLKSRGALQVQACLSNLGLVSWIQTTFQIQTALQSRLTLANPWNPCLPFKSRPTPRLLTYPRQSQSMKHYPKRLELFNSLETSELCLDTFN